MPHVFNVQDSSRVVLGSCLFFFVSISLLVERGISYGSALLLLVSMILLIVARKQVFPLTKIDKFVCVVFALFPISVALNLLLHRNIDMSLLDNSLRFLFVLPIYLLVRTLRPSSEYFFAGVVVSSIGAAISAIYEVFYLNQAFADGPFHRIKFGGFSLLFAFLALVFVLFSERKLEKSKLFFCLVAVFSGFLASLLSLSRGAWMAIPVVLTVVALLYYRKSSIRIGYVLLSLLGAFFVIGLIFTFNEEANHRLEKAKKDVENYFVSGKELEPKVDGSAGTRLEMWKAALLLFKESPIRGVGIEKYGVEKDKLIESGKVNPKIQQYNHPHSDYLNLLSEQGILGLVLFLMSMGALLYLCYGGFSQNYLMSASGIVLLFSYIVFGLTEPYFRFQESTTLFALFVAIFLAYKSSEHHKNQ